MTEIESVNASASHSWRDLPIEAGGRSLIEASAGTGKTWTIAVLYLRLLLQRELSPRQIVVATFTEPASQELRERIRLRVHEAMRWSEQPLSEPAPEEADEARQWLWQRWSVAGCAKADHARLRLALAELDSAPIGTLHGLCQRILRDYPFETGSQFVQGELLDGKSLAAECARDLLRRANQAKGDEDELPTLKSLTEQLAVLLRPGVSVPQVDPASLREGLPPDSAAGIKVLADDASIFRSNNPTQRLRGALNLLASWCGGAGIKLSDDRLAYLIDPEPEYLPEAWTRLKDGPELRLVDEALKAYLLEREVPRYRLWSERQAQAMQMLEQRLAARNQLTFDSLITRANEAVRNNPTLVDRLFEAWPVALVDEFQDTDALQYGVLDAIYRDAEGGVRGRLVMIGDPKQAIYSFRGGDIDTYRRAAASATDLLILDTNHRSDPHLVTAFNELYRLAGTELSTQSPHDIRYLDVKAVERTVRYRVGGLPCTQPLVLHFLPECRDKVGDRRNDALTACANQIAQMLTSGKIEVEGAPLRPGHIAVLLPKRSDVAALREHLSERGVPCVGAGRNSVFAGEWAQELQVLLHAIQHPHSTRATHAALATRLAGYDFGDLQALRTDPSGEARAMKWFEGLRNLWEAAGVLAVVREVLSRSAPRAGAMDGTSEGHRLLRYRDGERALTDVRHLGELLQEAEEEMHGPAQLLAWLATQRQEAAASADGEESQLRMESDARRVHLMTLHASKGLEFPVVFLPLMWDHAGRDEIALLPDAKGGRVVGFGDEAKRQHQQAGQDERFRVLYVALTRARHACHAYLLSPDRRKDARNNSGPARDPERSALDALVARWKPALPLDRSLALQWSEGWPWTAPPPLVLDTGHAAGRVVRPMPNRPVVLERLHSFSSLSKRRHSQREEQPAEDEDEEIGVGPEGADADALLPPEQVPSLEASALASPAADEVLKQLAWVRGANFGNALHQVFEERRIGVPMSDQHALIDTALRQHGVRLGDGVPPAEVLARIGQRMQGALDADLGGGLKLGALPARALRAEMGFHYRLDGIGASALRRVCVAHGVAFPESPGQTLFGLMHGKIDLVFEHEGRFHVLDYKGNHLGNPDGTSTLSDYARPSLDAVMRHHHYELQALLYTVALERLLRQRIPGYRRADHLGDAIYLFVRAAGLAPGAGIWRHRFSDAVLDAVDDVLRGGAARAADAADVEGAQA